MLTVKEEVLGALPSVELVDDVYAGGRMREVMPCIYYDPAPYVYTCVCVYVYMYIYMCTYVCVCIYMYVCIYIYICVLRVCVQRSSLYISAPSLFTTNFAVPS